MNWFSKRNPSTKPVSRRSHRATQRRRLATGIQRLDGRKLMAADIGLGIDIPMGPIAEPASEISTQFDTTQQNAAGDFELPLVAD